MSNFTVDYGTIHGMQVSLPAEGISGYDLVSVWAKAYTDYLFAQSILVSDECLVRSIGSDNAKEAMILGIQERCEPETAQVFRDIAEDHWEIALLEARHGKKKGYEVYLRNFSGYEPEIVEMLLKLRKEI